MQMLSFILIKFKLHTHSPNTKSEHAMEKIETMTTAMTRDGKWARKFFELTKLSLFYLEGRTSATSFTFPFNICQFQHLSLGLKFLFSVRVCV